MKENIIIYLFIYFMQAALFISAHYWIDKLFQEAISISFRRSHMGYNE